MTTQIRNTILCLTAVVALVAMSAVPAFAHHKDGHENGAAAEEEVASDDQTTQTTEEQSATSGQAESRDERSARTRSTREAEPDPTPSQAPPKTTGPSCSEYSQEDNGPYDHDSCDDSQGMHGSDGNGKCAGCTGKADDKSPNGQSRNDHNNGYECDNNGGVGKGNPPHARCPQPPTTTNLCPPGSDMAGVPVDSVESCDDDVRGNIEKRCPAGTDNAGDLMDDLEDCDVKGLVDSVLPRIIREAPAVEGSPGAILPFTGAGDLSYAIALGMLLIASGAIGMRLRKN